MPREIAFEDIRKGDDIEARYVRDGVAHTRRGIAHSVNPNPHPEYWYVEAGGLIANGYDGDWKFYLHHRPVPAEPKSLGAVVRATRLDRARAYALGRARVYVHIGDGAWVPPSGTRFAWVEFDPDSIEVLSEGIGVDQ